MLNIYSDEEVYWSESVNLGTLGKFDDITIDLDACDIAGINDNMLEEEKLSKITEYYSNRFKELEANADYISEQFLMWLVTHLCAIEYPFWESGDEAEGNEKYPDYIIEDEIQKFEDENGQVKHDPYSASPIYKEIQEYDAYTNKDNLSSYEIVAKYLSVLDFRKLIATIEPSGLDTFEDHINFGVYSEVCGGMLLCATYGTIYGDNKLEVTNNC